MYIYVWPSQNCICIHTQKFGFLTDLMTMSRSTDSLVDWLAWSLMSMHACIANKLTTVCTTAAACHSKLYLFPRVISVVLVGPLHVQARCLVCLLAAWLMSAGSYPSYLYPFANENIYMQACGAAVHLHHIFLFFPLQAGT